MHEMGYFLPRDRLPILGTSIASPLRKMMYYKDRAQAGEMLAEKLVQFKGKNPLVLGIPRGSVPMAKIISDHLDGDLDVVLVHKIGAPGNPEFAIGSVSEFGTIYESEAVQLYSINPNFIQDAAAEEVSKLKSRRQTYSPIRPPISPKDRHVIIVDDGIATGSTMLAAIRAIKSQDPKQIIVAAPVASPRCIDLLGSEADQLIILDLPDDFFAISQFYEDFPQVEDQEVIQILSDTAMAKKSA
jgi:predicted phosphoribosyltransferase